MTFLRWSQLATIVLSGLILAAPCRATDPPSRPNFLYLLADDWMYPHASCLGDAVIRTPTFDRLAREGVLFRNAYAAAPSCTPSRGAMLTGQWHWRLEQGANLNTFLPAKFATYPDVLEKAGYHVGFMRKGWAPGKETGGGRTRNPAGPRFKNFAEFLATRPKGKPFCFWFGSTDPHRPYEWECGIKSGMDPAKVVVPPYFPDCETVRKDICDYYFRAQRFDREAGELLTMLDNTGELDNTIVVMSGDNGWPFPRCKATVYESGTHQPLAIRWGAKVKPGRVVDDFVSLADLAPTFLEAAGYPIPKTMTARSLVPILCSDKTGQVDPSRDHVLLGMETHVPCRVIGNDARGGYPMRAIRTKDFHYIRNFKPERWPAGDPHGCEVAGAQPFTYEQLVGPALFPATSRTFGDVDASPTKAWMVLHRSDPQVKPLWERAFGKRPARELYDLHKDPYQMRNVADDSAYAEILKQLDAQLMLELATTDDPRAAGKGDQFDQYNELRPKR
jgi:N-sulfoglucosamine sulfohydrolase